MTPQDNEQTPSRFICTSCGEYETDCRCIAGALRDQVESLSQDLASLKHRLATAESERGWWNCQCHGQTEYECQCGSATAFVTYKSQLSTALAENERQRVERDRLADWKAQMLAVESEWDAQEIAKLLGATIGQSCRKVIAQRVPELLTQLEEVKKLEEHWSRQHLSLTITNTSNVLRAERAEANLSTLRSIADQLAKALEAVQNYRDDGEGHEFLKASALADEALTAYRATQ